MFGMIKTIVCIRSLYTAQ